MDLKKHLKLKEEEVPYSQKDKEFYESLLKDVQANAQNMQSQPPVAVKKPVKLWAWLTPVATVLVAVVVLTCIFVPRKNPEKLYSDDNIKTDITTMSALISDLQNIDLQIKDSDVEQVNMFYDSVSNDKLYYTLKFIADLSRVDFTVVINKDYKYKFDVTGETKTSELEKYSVTYTVQENSFDLTPSIDYKGWISVQEETVYFEYHQVPASGEQTFLNSIQQIVQVK